MVSENDLRPIVGELLDAFPSFGTWYSNLSPEQREGMRSAWTRQVATLQPCDVAEAAEGILGGRVPLPKNYEFDRLGVELRTWGHVAAAKRIENEKAATLREQARPAADPSVRGVNCRFGQAIKCASAWGAALRDGAITAEQNKDALVIVHRYHRHGDVELIWPEHQAVAFWKA